MVKKIAIVILGILIISACATTATSARIGSPMPVLATQTAMSNYTITPTSTDITTPRPTAFPTLAPKVTPTPGAVPDLELVNFSIKRWGSDKRPWLIGEVRNNSDHLMIFPGLEKGFHFLVDEYGQGNLDYFFSYKWDVDIYPGVSDQRMNCYLFPGETGGVAVDIANQGKSQDVYSKNPPLGFGFQLIGYESFPRRWEEFLPLRVFKDHYPVSLDPQLHPKISNLRYEIRRSETTSEGDALLLEFDVDYFAPEWSTASETPTWLFLYDVQDKLINILYAQDIACDGMGCYKSGIYHISGEGCNKEECPLINPTSPSKKIEWFAPKVELTNADILSVDHIRVIMETRDRNICREVIRWNDR